MLELLFDPVPDVTFFIKDTAGRIAVASCLLRETDQSVSDIALACGFYDHSAFTRAFRKVANVTPTQFREMLST